MAKRHRRCQRCGRYDHVCGRVSVRGLCSDCAAAAVAANLRALEARSGPAYDRWRQRSELGMLSYLQRRVGRQTNAPPDA